MLENMNIIAQSSLQDCPGTNIHEAKGRANMAVRPKSSAPAPGHGRSRKNYQSVTRYQFKRQQNFR
jgi:hypothetical protein